MERRCAVGLQSAWRSRDDDDGAASCSMRRLAAIEIAEAVLAASRNQWSCSMKRKRCSNGVIELSASSGDHQGHLSSRS